MPYLDLKDIKLYYEVEGEGPPFLFISETACDGAVWKRHSYFFTNPDAAHKIIREFIVA